MSMWTRIRNGIAPNPDTGLGGATEGDLSGLASDIIPQSGGVVNLSGGEALVTESTVPGMSVKIANGRIYIPNSSFSSIDSDTVRNWETVLASQADKTIAANSSGSARVDLVCAKMDTTIVPDEFASNIATIVIVTGTPGAGVPATPSNHYKLAEVAVANGASSIVNANITDRRAQIVINTAMLTAAGGDVSSNTSSSVDSEVALFSSTTGKIIKRATLSGIAKLTSGVLSVVTAPSGTIVGTTDTQTLTNKRNTRRAVAVTQSATPTMNTDNMDIALITALAQAITSMTTNLTGTPIEGDLLEVQITDNGTARAITWGSSFQNGGLVNLPTTTVISTKLRVLLEWEASKWTCVGVA